MEKFRWTDSPNQTAFPIAGAGYPYIAAAGFITLIFALLGWTILTLIGLVAVFAVCGFFRDPDRVIPMETGAVISPADGKIIVSERMDNSSFLEGECFKISIFMTVFNVHINRIPFGGKVVEVLYRPGKFFSADKDKASMKNEHNAVIVKTDNGWRYAVVQVAGWVARRIICRIKPGDDVAAGGRYGLICFGSRLDVYLPAGFEPAIQIGDKVRSGSTILGHKT